MKLPKFFPFYLILLGAFLAPGVVAAQSTAHTVAALQQEMEAMREEVRRLRVEVEDMKLALEQAQSRNNTAAVQQQLSSQTAAMQTQRAELIAEMDRRFSAMGNETNRAMSSLTKQVNDALKGAAPAPVVSRPDAGATTPPSVPSDMPRTGIRYKVKPGDTISRIARAQGSRLNWILAANNLSANSTIQPGQEIFVPQRDGTSGTNP